MSRAFVMATDAWSASARMVASSASSHADRASSPDADRTDEPVSDRSGAAMLERIPKPSAKRCGSGPCGNRSVREVVAGIEHVAFSDGATEDAFARRQLDRSRSQARSGLSSRPAS